jgi:hypothetical protein
MNLSQTEILQRNISNISLSTKIYQENKQIKNILGSMNKYQEELNLVDEISDSDDDIKDNSKQLDSIDPFDSSNSYYRKKLEKIKLKGNSYNTKKNLRTNDNSSSIASPSESFELEIEDQEENKINKSSCSNIILYDDECFSSEKSDIEDFTTLEILAKLRSLKRALKNFNQPHMNFDNFLKHFYKNY